MFSGWPEHIGLRDWQEKAFRKFFSRQSRDFLAVATPGAGKTVFALRCMAEAMRRGEIQRLIVVAPSTHLEVQWANAASRVGIHLDPTWENGRGGIAPDMHGICTTYAGVANGPEMMRAHCRIPTGVIFDEIHHAGEDRPWGENARHAFDSAIMRLALSGTPFRSDNSMIPFVRYEGGVSVSDFTYGYGDALADGVVRPVVFPAWDGDFHWQSHGRQFQATFKDDLNDNDKNKRLGVALLPDGEFIAKILASAVKQLELVREDHSDAAGLVTAPNIHHAKAYADVIRRLTGRSPSVVTSDDSDASREITRFSASREQWIVAVKMISEGVDIPRLRVGVYTTNITTEMYFRQFVGRFVRTQPGREDDHAHIFIIRDPRHIAQALAIEEERRHYIQDLEQEIEAMKGLSPEEREAINPVGDRLADPFVPLKSEGWSDGAVLAGQIISENELQYAEAVRDKYGFPKSIDPTLIANLLRGEAGTAPKPAPRQPEPERHDVPMHEVKERLRKVLKLKVNELAALTNESHKDINGRLKSNDGLSPVEMTSTQIQNRIKRVTQEIARARGDAN